MESESREDFLKSRMKGIGGSDAATLLAFESVEITFRSF